MRVGDNMREIIDDLHSERKCHPEDAYQMQFTRFIGGKMIKSRRYDITLQTLKEIVGAIAPDWEIWEKNQATGRYELTGTSDAFDGHGQAN